MALIDTHCHLNFAQLRGNLAELLEDGRKVGIRRWVVPSTDASTWNDIIALANASSGAVYYALGLHPYEILKHKDSDLDLLEGLICPCPDSCLAVGEIGLDATRPEFSRQVMFFERQLSMARHSGLPVIVHSRKTHSKVYKIIKDTGVRQGIVHAFSGSFQEAESFLSLGLKLGVGPVATWSGSSKTRQVFSSVPLESLVLETDAPDMPVSGKGKKEGLPADLAQVFAALCELRPESEKVVEQALWSNSCEVFNLTGLPGKTTLTP